MLVCVPACVYGRKSWYCASVRVSLKHKHKHTFFLFVPLGVSFVCHVSPQKNDTKKPTKKRTKGKKAKKFKVNIPPHNLAFGLVLFREVSIGW